MIKEQNYDFRKRMSQLHKPNLRDPNVSCRKDQLALEDGCVISVPENPGIVVLTAARDLVDFLLDSMHISARIVKKSDPAAQVRLLEECADLEEAAGYKGYRIDTDQQIQISAYDDRGAAQAFYRLEDMMRFAKGPFITKGTIKSRPLFSPRMVHSGYGLDWYPDSHLAQIAHEGRDAILIFVKDLHVTPYGYLDFNDLIRRSEKYGIDVYAYSYMPCSIHPDDENAEAFYENSFGKLFRSCPGLKGLILVGESLHFPSKDPALTDPPADVTGKLRSTHWPCEDYPELLSLIKRVVNCYNPNADIVFWTYNWGMIPEQYRLKLIERMPQDITLQATFEMFEEYKLGGSTQYCSDYTIARTGPGSYFSSEAAAAKKRNIKLYTMCNTGGRTWDFGTVPYIPCPYQWMGRFQALLQAQEDWGLSGLMESHHFGFMPSIISELSKWAFTTELPDMEQILHQILIRDYGENQAETVKTALKYWSDAMVCCTPTLEDQYGPLRIGPAYPLCFDKAEVPPSVPYAHLGTRIFNTLYPPRNYHHSAFSSVRISDEIDAFTQMHQLMDTGVQLLQSLAPKNDSLEQLIALGNYIAAIAKTVLHVKLWSQCRQQLYAEPDREKALLLIEKMQRIATDEIQNAADILWAVEADSSLGWEPSMEYLGDAEHIRWKINQVRQMRDIRLEELKVCLHK